MNIQNKLTLVAFVFTLIGLLIGYEQGKHSADQWYWSHSSMVMCIGQVKALPADKSCYIITAQGKDYNVTCVPSN